MKPSTLTLSPDFVQIFFPSQSLFNYTHFVPSTLPIISNYSTSRHSAKYPPLLLIAPINPLTHSCGALGLIFNTHFIQRAYYIISFILRDNFIFFGPFFGHFCLQTISKLQMSPRDCTVLHPSVFQVNLY